jgi:hypothetical protein
MAQFNKTIRQKGRERKKCKKALRLYSKEVIQSWPLLTAAASNVNDLDCVEAEAATVGEAPLPPCRKHNFFTLTD